MNYKQSREQNIKDRITLTSLCDGSEEQRARTLELCSRDPKFWINHFAWTKDPKKPFPRIAFHLYPYQEDYLQDIITSIETGKDLLVEKSRDMGASWMVIFVYVWYWRFHANSDFKMGSWKEDYVDKIGDMDSLFEKARFAINAMPDWMLPKGFDPDRDMPFTKILNPENGNTITGEAATKHFGSGGRRKSMFLDEHAKWDNNAATAAWTATADVTKCRIVTSTPVGSGNKFAELAKGNKEKIKKVTLHWTLHPEKNIGAYYLDGTERIAVGDNAFELWQKGIKIRSPWYDAECERRSESDIAQELDINYLKSGLPFFNIESLRKQKAWELTVRRLPTDPIPYGNYVRGKIRQINGKFDFFENEIEAWVKIYELPKGYMQYSLAADSSEGLAKGDESFAAVRDKYARNVVATINGIIPPDVYAQYIWLLAKFFNDADLAPENNNMGYAVCKDVELMGCNLYYMPKDEQDKSGDSKKRGFTTSVRTRPLFLSQAAEEVRLNQCEIRDATILSQMETFVCDPSNGIPRADGTFLDDGVIAFSICGQIITEKPLRVSRTSDTIKADLVSKRQNALRNGGFSFGSNG